MTSYIRKLASEGEGQNLEYKFEISDSKKISRTLAAFANSFGGRILLGVKDNGTISGVRSEEEYYMLEAGARLYCKPEVEFEAVSHMIDGKTVLEVKVLPGIRKPYYAISPEGKWRVYIRVRDENLLANRVLLKVWSRRRGGRGTFVRYTDIEKQLLGYLKEHELITITKFIKLAGLKYNKAENILVNLICLSIIEMDIGSRQTVYRLKAEHK